MLLIELCIYLNIYKIVTKLINLPISAFYQGLQLYFNAKFADLVTFSATILVTCWSSVCISVFVCAAH